MLSNIYVIAHKPDKFTKICLGSLFATTTPPFRITVVSHTASAAVNKNTVLNMANTDRFFLVNDDIQFITHGWNTLLLESLDFSPEVAFVSAVVRLPKRAPYQPMTTFAPENCLVTNIRMTDCVLAVKRTTIRFIERFKVSQGDDIAFFLDSMKQRLIPAVDTRVLVKHLDVPNHGGSSYLKHNERILYSQWGSRAKEWGQDPSKFIVLKNYNLTGGS